MVYPNKMSYLMRQYLIADVATLVLDYLETFPGLIYIRTIALQKTWNNYPHFRCESIVCCREDIILFNTFYNGTLIQHFDIKGRLQRQKIHFNNDIGGHESQHYIPCSNNSSRLIVVDIKSHCAYPRLVSIDSIWERGKKQGESIPFNEILSDIAVYPSERVLSSGYNIFVCDEKYNFKKSLWSSKSICTMIISTVIIENEAGQRITYALCRSESLDESNKNQLLEITDSGIRVLDTFQRMHRDIHFYNNHLFMVVDNRLVCYSVSGERIKLNDVIGITFTIRDKTMYVLGHGSQLLVYQIVDLMQ